MINELYYIIEIIPNFAVKIVLFVLLKVFNSVLIRPINIRNFLINIL
jgi:hypothetical protein